MRKFITTVAAATVLATAGGIAFAATSGSNPTVTVCVAKTTGTYNNIKHLRGEMRMVASCLPWEAKKTLSGPVVFPTYDPPTGPTWDHPNGFVDTDGDGFDDTTGNNASMFWPTWNVGALAIGQRATFSLGINAGQRMHTAIHSYGANNGCESLSVVFHTAGGTDVQVEKKDASGAPYNDLWGDYTATQAGTLQVVSPCEITGAQIGVWID